MSPVNRIAPPAPNAQGDTPLRHGNPAIRTDAVCLVCVRSERSAEEHAPQSALATDLKREFHA
jgi:hypothetical protein